RQRTLLLVDQPAPGNLDRPRPDPFVAGRADPLFMIETPTPVRRPDQAGQAADVAAIAELPPGEELGHEQPRGLVTDATQRYESADQRHRRIALLPQLEPARALERRDLRGEERDFLPLPDHALPERRRDRVPVPLPQAIEPRGELRVHGEIDAHRGEQAGDAIGERGRSRFNAHSSRGGCRRSSSCALGMCTTRHTFVSPLTWRRSIDSSFVRSRASVFARRARRLTSMLDESTTRLSPPIPTRYR